MIRSVLASGLSLSVAATGLLLTSPSQANVASAAPGITQTHFAMEASGYSTRVIGGDVPVDSDRTAFQIIACTNKAGLSKRNSQAALDLDGIQVSAAKTHVWTTEKGGTVSSWAQNHIAKVTIEGVPAITTDDVVLRGVDSLSRTWHNGTGYHARTKATVAAVTLGGAPVDLLAPGQTLDLGIVSLTIGKGKTSEGSNGAKAMLDAVRLNVTGTDTRVFLAHSRSEISGGVKSGLFAGSAYASRANLLDGTVTSGKTPLIVMPCQGTNGKVISKDIARVDTLGVVLKGLHADQSADQTRSRANAYERGQVARLALGPADRSLVVKGIVGKANVNYVRGKGISMNTKGSSLGGVRLNGERLNFGRDGVINIAGLVKLQQHIVDRTKRTIQVIELRVTLLGGANDGAKIDLGVAKVGFRKVNF